MTSTEEEARFQGTVLLCPVCQWPDGGARRCQRCGWQLIGQYVAGEATPDDHRELADRLAAAQQQYDVRAAIRAVSAGGGNDAFRLSWLAGCARGGPPSARQLQRAADEVSAADAPAAALPGIEYALVRLVAGETDGIAFVEIGPDAVTGATLIADQLGVPRRGLAGSSRPWSELLPGLPAEIDLARFQLAGGIGAAHADGQGLPAGSAGPVALGEAADDAMADALTDILGAASAAALDAMTDSSSRGPGRGPGASLRPARLDVVLVRRGRGWAVLDVATRRAWLQARPVTEICQAMTAGTLAQLVDGISRRAPLRHAYELILVKVDPRSGAVRPYPQQLFAPGAVARPGKQPEATVVVLPPPHAAEVIELPIVARRGDRDTDWPLVDSRFIAGTDGGPTSLQIRLHGPGRLRTRASRALLTAPAAGSTWPRLLGRLPSRLRPPPALDVAFLVELGGYDDAAVARRVTLVRDVVGAFHAAAASATSVEVAILGYRDHYGKHQLHARAARDQLVILRGLKPAASALSTLDRRELWARVPVRDDYAAPLECALHLVAEGGVAWRPGTRRVVLIVGSRPPHPYLPDNQGSLVRTCPQDAEWRDDLDVLRHDQAVRCLAVQDQPPPYQKARLHTDQAWRELPLQGLFPIETATPARLVQAAGLAPDGGASRLSLAVRAESPMRSSSKGDGQ